MGSTGWKSRTHREIFELIPFEEKGERKLKNERILETYEIISIGLIYEIGVPEEETRDN